MSEDEFLNRAKQYSPKLEVLSEYKGTLEKVHVRCIDCGYESDILAGALTRKSGHGCNRCSGLIHKTTEMFMEEIKDVEITPMEEYINALTPMLFRCNKCRNEWRVRPSDVLSGAMCPHCKRNQKLVAKRIALVDFMKKFDPTIKIVGEYIGRHNHIKCRCNICGNEWDAAPGNLVQGCGCPACKSSAGERRIRAYLIDHNVDYIQEHRFDDCRDEHVLPFDFFIPAMNLVIEYDGEQHYRPVKFAGINDGGEIVRYLKTLRRDAIKNRYCSDNNIRLVRIPYTDYNEIDNILNELIA